MQINTASGMLSTESLCVVTTDSDEKQSSNGQHAITRTIVHLNSIGEGIRCSLGVRIKIDPRSRSSCLDFSHIFWLFAEAFNLFGESGIESQKFSYNFRIFEGVNHHILWLFSIVLSILRLDLGVGCVFSGLLISDSLAVTLDGRWSTVSIRASLLLFDLGVRRRWVGSVNR
ncbi:hypothetical protein KCU69_g23, partial [Aureobasidium melanogenum]